MIYLSGMNWSFYYIHVCDLVANELTNAAYITTTKQHRLRFFTKTYHFECMMKSAQYFCCYSQLRHHQDTICFYIFWLYLPLKLLCCNVVLLVELELPNLFTNYKKSIVFSRDFDILKIANCKTFNSTFLPYCRFAPTIYIFSFISSWTLIIRSEWLLHFLSLSSHYCKAKSFDLTMLYETLHMKRRARIRLVYPPLITMAGSCQGNHKLNSVSNWLCLLKKILDVILIIAGRSMVSNP